MPTKEESDGVALGQVVDASVRCGLSKGDGEEEEEEEKEGGGGGR